MDQNKSEIKLTLICIVRNQYSEFNLGYNISRHLISIEYIIFL